MAAALRTRGVHVLTSCAVRGVETSGGAVSYVVTEYGRIRCSSMVVAGGAWTRLFAGNLGIGAPQLMVRSLVLRTAPLEGGPNVSACNHAMGYRNQLDGGYTIANALRSYSDITPDSFRLFFKYLPAPKSQLASLKFGFNAHFFEEWRRPCRWPLDRPTIFETQRTLDPALVASFNKTAIDEFRAIFPELANLKVEQEWPDISTWRPMRYPSSRASSTCRDCSSRRGSRDTASASDRARAS